MLYLHYIPTEMKFPIPNNIHRRHLTTTGTQRHSAVGAADGQGARVPRGVNGFCLYKVVPASVMFVGLKNNLKTIDISPMNHSDWNYKPT